MLNAIKLALLSCLIVVPVLLEAHADELKIGYVNMERVMRDAPAAIKVAKKIEQEFEGRRKELQKLADEIQARQTALSAQGPSLSDGERRTKESELAELSARFQRGQREFQEDLRVRQNDETAAIVQKANDAVVQIAKSEHLDLILQEAIAISSRVDITDKVIKKMADD